MNRKVDFDKQKIKSLAEVSNVEALKILRMAIKGDVSLIYFLDDDTYRILGFKDLDALLASFPNSMEIYPNGKSISFSFDEGPLFRESSIQFTKIISPNNVYFMYAAHSVEGTDRSEESIIDRKDMAQANIETYELCWKKSAVKLFNELELDKSFLSLEQKAKKIEKEMQSRHAAGVKGMTKRGGKKTPSASSILRHALQNI